MLPIVRFHYVTDVTNITFCTYVFFNQIREQGLSDLMLSKLASAELCFEF